MKILAKNKGKSWKWERIKKINNREKRKKRKENME